jgi:hypothetical protein
MLFLNIKSGLFIIRLFFPTEEALRPWLGPSTVAGKGSSSPAKVDTITEPIPVDIVDLFLQPPPWFKTQTLSYR